MFGFNIPDATVYCGLRAILEGGHVDVIHDRCSLRGDEADTDKLIGLANKTGAWRRMIKWAKGQSGSSREVFSEEIENDQGRVVVLRASPQASYGYLYIGIGRLETPKMEVAANVA